MRIGDIYAMMKNRAIREQLYCTPEYWDSKAESFVNTAVSMWPNSRLNAYYHREQIHWLNGHIRTLAGKRLLDAGCGVGRLSRYFADRGARVVGFDFSARAIELAQRQSDGDNPRYRVQSVFDLREQNSYDIIIVWGVLTVACRNRAELLSALKRLHEALVPGGHFLLMEPIHSGFLHRVLNLGIEEFCSVMREAGFNIQDITHLHFWPARLALAYFELPGAVTTVGYYGGQVLLTLLRRKAMGDYKAIFATN